MEQLTRTRVEQFGIEDSLTLSQIETLRDEGRIEEILTPIDAMFDGPKAIAGEWGDKKLCNGNPVLAEDFSCLLVKTTSGLEEEHPVKELPKTGLVRVYSSHREFLGLYAYEESRRWWKPKKCFQGRQMYELY